MPRSTYLRTNEHEEAVRSLEWAENQARFITTDPYLWKWIILSLHNAAQGFMVLSLWNGNGLLALQPNVAAKWLKAYESGGPFPNEKLDKFLNLYAKVKDPNNFSTIGSTAFVPNRRHDISLEQLNTIRNIFTHFTPKGWSLELAGLPNICLDTLEMIEFLGITTTAILWYKPTHRARTQKALKSLKRTFTKLAG